jgi:hypothetical protein
MTNFSVQDATGATKEFKATSGDGSGGSPFVSEVALADVGETVDVGRVNLIGTAQSNGAVRATGATIPAYAVAMGASDGTNMQIPRCDTNKSLFVALQAGTGLPQAIGKLSANSGVDIGDVDVTSMPLAAALQNGQKYVTSAGTRVALASSTAIYHSVTIMAQSGNSGWIYIGNSSVSNSNGYILDAGETVTIEIANLSTIYVDSSVNGEGVSYIAT